MTDRLQRVDNIYHFKSANGVTVNSKEHDWEWNDQYQGYYYYGRRHIYFTRNLPS